MAEALIRHEAGDVFQVFSAGTHPAQVRVEAVAVMRELGIDISAQQSKPLTEFEGQNFDFVITVCDRAREECPIFSGGQKGFIGRSKIQRYSPRRDRSAYMRSVDCGTGITPA